MKNGFSIGKFFSFRADRILERLSLPTLIDGLRFFDLLTVFGDDIRVIMNGRVQSDPIYGW